MTNGSVYLLYSIRDRALPPALCLDPFSLQIQSESLRPLRAYLLLLPLSLSYHERIFSRYEQFQRK